ncbi:MAG: cation:proton antiporter [Ruminococcaceae bacterium]|nr:cation:proton antiporter [Oscillospiraceae bacterium]
MDYLISLSVAMLGGLMLSRLAKKLHLPAVTAYLVAGLLLGPFCIGVLKIKGIGFGSLHEVESLSVICQVALGFIAFTIGNEFRLSQLRSMGSRAITIGIAQAVATTIVVDVALIVLHFIAPNVLSVPAALVLGAIASATAPAATLMVVRQYKANGPLTKLLMLVVAIDDAVGLLLFSASFGIANAIENGALSINGILIEPIIEIVLSLGVGALIGLALDQIERFFHSRSKRTAISVAFVLLAVGLSDIKFTIAGVHCGFSLLLLCMMAGTVFCNVCDFSEELMGRVDSWTVPISILFFVISGAELDLSMLIKPYILLIGGIYILSRTCGKYFGARLSCKLTHCNQAITKYLGITLFPQAGVALGMALTAASLADGEVVRNVVLLAVLIYELVGPALTKISLTKAGEITPEGKTSARRPNDPKPPIVIHKEKDAKGC